MRWLGMASIAMSVSIAACGDRGGKAPAPVDNWQPAPDAQAIVGNWTDGQTTFVFGANGNYSWDKVVPCGAPPCPVTSTTGTYQVRGNKVYLNPPQGNDITVDFAFENKQSSVRLQEGSASFLLNKR